MPLLVVHAVLTASLVVGTVQGQDPGRPSGEPVRAEPERSGAQEPGEQVGERAGERTDEPARARQDDPEDAVIVTATRAATPQFDSPFSTAVVTHERFRQRAYRTVPQALRDIPGVMVQETSITQGSPFIRGFTGYDNLMLIDGIRLNHSAFRSGPNQYWATVDPMSLERLEVVKGPSSVLYGSDAIGGTVQAFTKDPWTTGEGFSYGGTASLRFASSDSSIWGRGELSFGQGWDDGSHTSMLIGADRKYFDDREAGGDSGTLPYTAYDEAALDLKIVHRFDDHTRLVFAHQNVRQYDAPRTHRTQFAVPFHGSTVGTDLLHEFEQQRRLTYAQVHSEGLNGIFDAVHASLSLHSHDEVRKRLRSSGPDRQGFDLDTYGAWVQFESDTSLGRLTYGLEWYHDEVDSFSTANPIQGPVGDDASYDLAAVYLQDEIRLDDRFSAIVGGRFNYAAVDANRVEDPNTGTPIGVDEDWNDVVFSLRLRYELIPDELALHAGASQGFRAPSLSDLTAFDSARSNEFEIPAPGLDSENYITYELGMKGRTEAVSFDVTGFYTDISDRINRFPTGNVNSGGEVEVTKANVGDGYVYGIEAGTGWRVVENTTLFGNVTWMKGEIDNYETLGGAISREYLSRLMPLTAQAGIRWEQPESRLWAETLVRWADDADRLSSSDQGDTQRIPPGGTPSYTVWDLGFGWRMREDTTLDLRLENILDEDYRVHGSGSNMPGRQVVIALETRF